MNKNNKGSSALKAILFVVIVLLIAFGAYQFGKNSEQKRYGNNSDVVSLPEEIPDSTNTHSSMSCDAESTPSIKVTSPNGGEVYTAGQQITVNWTTCNISRTNPDMNISLSGGTLLSATTPNDGSQVVTIPSSTPTGNYQIAVGNASARIIGDGSDRAFTINAARSNISTTISSQYIVGTHWPPTIQISATPYSCSASTGEVTTVVQKIINGKTYCVNSTVDGGAGHFGGDYIYTRANGSGTKTATFQLQWPSCGGYGGPNDPIYVQCKTEQNNVFNRLDAMVDSLM